MRKNIRRKLINKYGTTLTGEQYYQVYSTYGFKEEELLNEGFAIEGKSGFYSAKLQHTQDSDTLNFKFWKEGILEGGLTIWELVDDKDLTEKQAINLMKKLCEELKAGWPELKNKGSIILRAASFNWFYERCPEYRNWMIKNANSAKNEKPL